MVHNGAYFFSCGVDFLNNKGLTLIELLIVIIVIGLIATFSVAAVQSAVDRTKKEQVYQDALAVNEAATRFCTFHKSDCMPRSGRNYKYLKIGSIEEYLDGLDGNYYDLSKSIVRIYQGDFDHIQVRLRAKDSSDYSWKRFRDPQDPSNMSNIKK
jgi:prepilin-type N-terminal cleavage/methylation domain-containing protein